MSFPSVVPSLLKRVGREVRTFSQVTPRLGRGVTLLAESQAVEEAQVFEPGRGGRPNPGRLTLFDREPRTYSDEVWKVRVRVVCWR
jgi:hypothetical protein